MIYKQRSFIYSILIVLSLAACQPAVNTAAKTIVEDPCMGPPKKDTMCTMQYDPVCGCNGKTYSNACMAKVAGVLRMEKGVCEDGTVAGQDQL